MTATSAPALSERVASIVAAALAEPALVIGSLPPGGRDLDLLVRASAREPLERALVGNGLVPGREGLFALFDHCSGYAVELIAAESYLPPPALERLFSAARPLPGREPLAEPSEKHALLILARLVADEGRLADKRRRRLERILAGDPEAWAKARREAREWGADGALEALAQAARREQLARESVPEWTGRARRVIRRLPRRRALLVSLSGLDGSGKSSQSRWLAETLAAVGVDAEVVWNNLDGSFALDLIAAPARLVLSFTGRQPEPMAEDRRTAPAGPEEQERLGRRLWSGYVSFTNALEQRVLLTRSRLRHRVVVFDRGPLDLAVRMQVLYRAAVDQQRRLVELGAPQPDVAVFLDIPPELSRTRKDDRWSLEQLREHAALYRELAPRFGVRRLDGQRPPEELAAEIARAVWERL